VRIVPERIVVLTSSFPRFEGDFAGRFVADAVAHLRARGLHVDVVGPERPADGGGLVRTLTRRPWLVVTLFVSLTRELRRAARDADLVHAHWLPTGLAALGAGKPVVLTLHGTDVELARRAPWLARRVLRRARLVVCVSSFLADEARKLGAREIEVVPNGVELPESVGEPEEPPHILFAGRLSPEKGVLELVEAARGLPLVVAGDGPLRDRVPDALGFVPHDEVLRLIERAAVVAAPSRREGFGVTVAEAMARGRPVVASAVGGLLDLVVDGETGLLVPPRDPAALRAALERLLGDGELRARLGAAARERARERFSWPVVTDSTLAAYEQALR
jgi:glycosyltransferase involved in cell wall biosynthesis